jgi:hypothetical protein
MPSDPAPQAQQLIAQIEERRGNPHAVFDVQHGSREESLGVAEVGPESRGEALAVLVNKQVCVREDGVLHDGREQWTVEIGSEAVAAVELGCTTGHLPAVVRRFTRIQASLAAGHGGSS